MIDSLMEDLQWNEAMYLCALCVYNDVSEKLMILLTWGEITAVEERNLQESKWNQYAAWFCNEQYVHTQADVNSDEWFNQNQRQGAIRNGERGKCEREWLHQLPAENSATASDRKKSEIPGCVFETPTSSGPCLPPWSHILQLSLLQPPRHGTDVFLFFKQVRVFLSSRPLFLVVSLCELFFWLRVSPSPIPILLFFHSNRTLAQLMAAQKRNHISSFSCR